MAIFRVKDENGNIYDIPVVKGEPGYTPRRGDDYFTDADIQEFKNYVDEEIAEHAASTDNPHSVTAEQVGLGNVDNTSDRDKPVSTAQAEAIAQAQSVAERHINDDGNPHNVTFAQVGAASAGYGYGETMVWLGYDAVNNKASGTFQADLEALFAKMPSGTCKQIQFMDTALASAKFTGTLWKYTGSYGVLSVINYSGIKALKTYYNGTWSEWVRENPNMASRTNYLTPERHQGDPVYVRLINCGVLPKSTTKMVSHDISGTIVSFEAYAKSDAGIVAQFPIIDSSLNVTAKMHIGNSDIAIVTGSDLSHYTAFVIIKYTK